MSTILLVEDNPHIMKINAQLMTLRGYQVLQAEKPRPRPGSSCAGTRWT